MTQSISKTLIWLTIIALSGLYARFALFMLT